VKVQEAVRSASGGNKEMPCCWVIEQSDWRSGMNAPEVARAVRRVPQAEQEVTNQAHRPNCFDEGR
jgi:predicted HAD superfamily Cof-like phosphohydrolase